MFAVNPLVPRIARQCQQKLHSVLDAAACDVVEQLDLFKQTSEAVESRKFGVISPAALINRAGCSDARFKSQFLSAGVVVNICTL
jgi:hypothetical protein